MFRHSLLVVSAALVFGLFAYAQDPPADLKKFEGQWSMVRAEKGGEKTPPEVLKTVLKFKGDSMISEMPAVGERPARSKEAKFTIDPTKSPKAFDVIPSDGREKGKAIKGIYKFDGDDLVLCMPQDSNVRPEDFASPAGSQNMLITLRRKK